MEVRSIIEGRFGWKQRSGNLLSYAGRVGNQRGRALRDKARDFFFRSKLIKMGQMGKRGEWEKWESMPQANFLEVYDGALFRFGRSFMGTIIAESWVIFKGRRANLVSRRA